MKLWVLGLGSWVLVLAGAAAAQPTLSVRDGVYTDAQAERGSAVYRSNCASCHTPGYFSDTSFYANFADKPLWELFDVVSDSMPEDNPGSLNQGQYADVIAFMLKLNKFPSGGTELPPDKEMLSNILMEKPAPDAR